MNHEHKLDSIKMSNNQATFLKSIQDVFSIYDPSELQNSEKLVLFVMKSGSILHCFQSSESTSLFLLEIIDIMIINYRHKYTDLKSFFLK